MANPAKGKAQSSLQVANQNYVHLVFQHRLSELGLPAWMAADTHPLTRHLVGVADNTAEVDEALTGDPRAFGKRACDVLGLNDAVTENEPALPYVASTLWNRLALRRQLREYADDKAVRPYIYSR